jgi:NAD(P)-dependent dehydrogenase (short-subunit alcohol dehydrogenase family)
MINTMKGKVALITGGSSGIGRAAALAFASEGAKVILASRTATSGEAVVAAIRENGGEAWWFQADVTQANQVEALIRETISTFGRLDYAFNNAGSGGKGGLVADLEEEEWDQSIETYLKSVWLCMKYEIRAMLAGDGGAIVNNSSVDGERAFPWDPAYSAAKHGVLGLTKSAALKYIQNSIRINAVCPGWIKTPLLEELIENPGAEQEMLRHQPIGRLGKPEEVAQAVVWLCSEAASFIVGTAVAVDGGYLAV